MRRGRRAAGAAAAPRGDCRADLGNAPARNAARSAGHGRPAGLPGVTVVLFPVWCGSLD